MLRPGRDACHDPAMAGPAPVTLVERACAPVEKQRPAGASQHATAAATETIRPMTELPHALDRRATRNGSARSAAGDLDNLPDREAIGHHGQPKIDMAGRAAWSRVASGTLASEPP